MGKIGSYKVDITINDILGEVLPSTISFSLSDSIYSLYSRATLEINDVTGFGLESRLFTPGVNIGFIFGFDEDVIKTNFIINSMETQGDSQSGRIGGRISMDLIHESFGSSHRDSQVLSNRPSDNIEKIFKFKFKSYDIEETKTLKIDNLYQPLLTEEETLEKVLLPNSISSKTKPSSYFCFININGEISYRSFSHLMGADASYHLFQSVTEKLDLFYSKIYSFYPFTEKMEMSKNNLVHNFSYFNENLEKEEEEIDIASVNFGGYPIFKTNISPNPYFLNIEDPDYLIDDKAHLHYSQRNLLLPNKIIITTPLFLGYTSGKTITINARYGEDETSYSYSKKYLIERSSHVWDGKKNRGTTQLIISKAFPEFPPSSNIKKGVYTK